MHSTEPPINGQHDHSRNGWCEPVARKSSRVWRATRSRRRRMEGLQARDHAKSGEATMQGSTNVTPDVHRLDYACRVISPGRWNPRADQWPRSGQTDSSRAAHPIFRVAHPAHSSLPPMPAVHDLPHHPPKRERWSGWGALSFPWGPCVIWMPSILLPYRGRMPIISDKSKLTQANPTKLSKHWP